MDDLPLLERWGMRCWGGSVHTVGGAEEWLGELVGHRGSWRFSAMGEALFPGEHL